ncbi:MAG: iron-sulfur cluster assembly protein [Pseudomonadota bacterium]
MTIGDDSAMRAPPPGYGLSAFMPELEVVEPEWFHDKRLSGEVSDVDPAVLQQKLVDNLSQIFDPEIPVNIYDLGLIYRIDVREGGAVHILMTLTAPNCPVAGTLPLMVEKGADLVPGVTSVEVELTWEPTWTLDMASEDARLILDF